MSSTAAALLQQRLGLGDDELLEVLAADPLELLSGELDHRPELGILLALTEEALEAVGEDVLRRWVRASGPQGRPLALLLARDFAGFERACDDLARRGFVLRGGG